MKILLSAYACEPDKGSEPAVGWNWALQAAQLHDVWVLTRSNNREAIESELANHGACRPHVVYHDLPRWARFWKRGRRGVHLYYLLWQLTGIRVARRLHREVGFDLAHHVTLVSFRFPSLLAWVDVPYIWGPVAGAETAPKSFYRIYGPQGAVQQALRDLSNKVARFDPLVRRTRARAALVLAATPETGRELGGARVIPAIGIEPHPEVELRPGATRQRRTRLLYVGNLVYLKGLQLLLPAFARSLSRGLDAELTIAGAGPDRARLESMAERLGISDAVDFTGAMPRDAVLRLYSQFDLFVFPSLRDSGGLVVLEAMAAGLPVIALDLGGPSLAITPSTGVLVPPRHPAQVIDDLADAMCRLGSDRNLMRALGSAGRARALALYGWDHKRTVIQEVYDEVGRWVR